MKYNVSWLPKLVKYNPQKGTETEYIEAIYKIFVEEFINQGLYFKGEKLGLKKHPLRSGKEATFYHMVSQGEEENSREIDFDRCARIKWPRAILASNYPGLKIWENKRKTKKNILVWFEEQEYLIVIRKNPNQKLIWTAYTVTHRHRQRKLNKEYQDYIAEMQKSLQV